MKLNQASSYTAQCRPFELQFRVFNVVTTFGRASRPLHSCLCKNDNETLDPVIVRSSSAGGRPPSHLELHAAFFTAVDQWKVNSKVHTSGMIENCTQKLGQMLWILQAALWHAPLCNQGVIHERYTWWVILYHTLNMYTCLLLFRNTWTCIQESVMAAIYTKFWVQRMQAYSICLLPNCPCFKHYIQHWVQ